MRDAVSRCHVQVDRVSPVWFAVAACVSGIQDLSTDYQRPSDPDRRHRLMDTVISTAPRDAASPRFGRAVLSGRLGLVTCNTRLFHSFLLDKAGIPQRLESTSWLLQDHITDQQHRDLPTCGGLLDKGRHTKQRQCATRVDGCDICKRVKRAGRVAESRTDGI